MAEKTRRASGGAIGARLQDCQEITSLQLRQGRIAGQGVERCAERADDGCRFLIVCLHHGRCDDGVVALDDLAEIAGGGEVMVHAAIHHHEGSAARGLYRIHLRHIDAAGTGEETAGFDDDMGVGYQRMRLYERLEVGNGGTDRCKIERRFACEIGDAETAAEIDGFERLTERPGHARGKGNAVSPLGDKHVGIENLRAAVNMDADEIDISGVLEEWQDVFQLFLIETEGRRLAAHAHGAGLCIRHRIDADRGFDRLADRLDAANFLGAFDVDFADAALDHFAQFGFAFAGAGEDDVFRCDTGLDGGAVFTDGSDFRTGAFLAEKRDDGGQGIGLHRIIDVGKATERRFEIAIGAAHGAGVIEKAWCSGSGDNIAHGKSTDHQIVFAYAE
ncbi:hypothetical protein D3C71_884590 [compost metagenome]